MLDRKRAHASSGGFSMQFRSEEYYQASLERMKQATKIHQLGGNYALAMYCAGLAVECMPRAFRWTEDASFEGRHDLNELLKASGLLSIDENYMRKKEASDNEIIQSARRLRSAMNLIAILWHNSLRFASEASLRAFLNRSGKLQGIRGDALKKNSQDLLNESQMIVTRGLTLWTLNKKSKKP